MTVPPHRSKMVQIFQSNKWSTDWWNIMKYHPKERICYNPTYSPFHSQVDQYPSRSGIWHAITAINSGSNSDFCSSCKGLQAPSRWHSACLRIEWNFTPRGLGTLREIREWNKANFICYIFNIASPISIFNAVQKHKKRLNEIGAINEGSDSYISMYDMYVNTYIYIWLYIYIYTVCILPKKKHRNFTICTTVPFSTHALAGSWA